MSNRIVSNGPHLITTAPSVTTCAGCGEPLLAATVGGVDHRVGLTPLNDYGELAALLAGRATFELRGELLVHRNATHMASERAATVLADHVCGPVPDGWTEGAVLDAAVALLQRMAGAVVLDDEPNF